MENLLNTMKHLVTVIACATMACLPVSLRAENVEPTNDTPDHVVFSYADDHNSYPVEYYDMQGRVLRCPPSSGLYIRRQGSNVKKILIP